MQLLQRCMLRRQNALLSKQYAMTTLKLHLVNGRIPNVSFREGEFNSQKTIHQHPSLHSIELQNKQLYLKYVEEVLTAKEQELMQLEEHLALRRAKLDEQEGEQRLGIPLIQGQQAQLLARKATTLREVAFKLASNRNQAAVVKQIEALQGTLLSIEEQCRKGQEAAYTQLQQAMQELTAERRELAARRSKLGELESFQKYLNQLQAAIQRKECQVILREREVQQQSLALCESNTHTLSLKNAQFNTYQEDSTPISHPNPNLDISNTDQSIRKRAKIFQPRTSQQAINHKESSKIMQETSTNDYTKQKLSKGSQISQPIVMASIGQQTSMDNQLISSCLRLESEKATVKFLRLWLKFSEKTNKNGGQVHQKTMTLYLWRLNALFDEHAKRKIEQAISWPRRLPSNIDYKALSLKKRKYFQLFFEHQRKIFQRQKTLVRLKTVLKNKNRRERTAVLLTFQKIRNNSRLMSLMALFQGAPTERVLTEKPSNPTIQSKPRPSSRADSRVLGSSTSNTNTENRLLSQHSKGKLNHRLTPSSSTVSKSKVHPREQAAIDIPRLKEYIKNQEETEVKLATECAQTESVFRIYSVLATTLTRLQMRFIVNSIRIGETSKLNALQKAMSGCQFKWELFMAKARLALTTNSNKIAHLEQLVGFMDSK